MRGTMLTFLNYLWYGVLFKHAEKFNICLLMLCQ